MGDQGVVGLVRAPEILEFLAGDPFFERAQEINDLITRRAYELFEARGLTHGQDREDWVRAESEILLRVPVDVTETQDQFTVLAEVAGFTDEDRASTGRAEAALSRCRALVDADPAAGAGGGSADTAATCVETGDVIRREVAAGVAV